LIIPVGEAMAQIDVSEVSDYGYDSDTVGGDRKGGFGAQSN
jgi:hypothetical protein